MTPYFKNNDVECSGTPKTFTITVNPTAVVNDITAQTVCNGDNTTAVTFGTTNTGGTMRYAWTNNTTSIGLAASGEGNIAAFTAVNDGTEPVVATITVTPYFKNNDVECNGPQKTFTITVNPQIRMNEVADQNICHGAEMAAVEFGTTMTGGTTTYAWTRDNDNVTGIATSGTGNIDATALSNTTMEPQTVTFTVRPTFTANGISCEGVDSIFTVTVNPQIRMNEVADQNICHGAEMAAVEFGTTMTGGTTTYAWTRDNTTNVTGIDASGTGNIPATALSNLTATAQTVTFTVRPTFTANGISCEGADSTFTVTVNPKVVMNTPASQELCSATDLNVSFGTSITDGTMTYAWTRDNTSNVIGTESGTGDISDVTLKNVTSEPQITVVSVTPTYANNSISCTVDPITFNITVRPSILTEGNVTFTVRDTAITLVYGVSDTLIELARSWSNNMTDMTVTLDSVGVPSTHRYRPGTHVVKWILRDECGDTVTFLQHVAVTYPDCGFPVYDANGNAYPTAQIGSNCWMTRNMRAVDYWRTPSEVVPIVPDPMQYPGTEVSPWDTVYGKLYTYYAATGITPTRATPPAQVRGICPLGWHIPDDDDFVDLMATYEASELMSSEEGHWMEPGTDNHGFSLEPAGYFNPDLNRYEYLHVNTILWSYTSGSITVFHACQFGSSCGTIEIIPISSVSGLSVRCVHD